MKQLLKYIKKNKNWWIIPAVVVIIIFAILVFVTNTIPLASFVYPLF